MKNTYSIIKYMHTIYKTYYSQTLPNLSSAKKTMKGTTLKMSLEAHVLKVTGEIENSFATSFARQEVMSETIL